MKSGQETSPSPPGSERRTEARIPMHVEVRFAEVSEAVRALRAFTTNVSVGGLCLRTQHAYPVGHRLRLTLTVQGHTLHLQGMVAWTRGEAIGVRFVDVSDEDRSLLRGLMASAQLDARATSRSG